MTQPHLLLVDDEQQVLKSFKRILGASGYEVTTAESGQAAIQLLTDHEFDVIVSDIMMPGMTGLQLLRKVREHDLDVPVVLMTGVPGLEGAVEAVELGAFRYLAKPVDIKELLGVVERAVRLHRMAAIKSQALDLLGNAGKRASDLAGLEVSFNRGLAALWMAYQPIISWSRQTIFGFEALLRTTEPTIPHPGEFLSMAERLGRLNDLGRAIRNRVAGAVSEAPAEAAIFINLHAQDLLDEQLFDESSPLAGIASRVILEITERASLDGVKDVRSRVADLKRLGFRIAIDDLGAGYAGLTSLANLEPEVVKIDMSLIRDLHQNATKRKLVQSITTASRELGMQVIAEGIEIVEERDALIELGSDLFQGYLFAKPGKPFPTVSF